MTWGTSAGGSALITALTDSDFLPGENTGPETEHTVIATVLWRTYMVPELWQKRPKDFLHEANQAEAMFKPSNGMALRKSRKMMPDQHLKPDSPPSNGPW